MEIKDCDNCGKVDPRTKECISIKSCIHLSEWESAKLKEKERFLRMFKV